MDEKQVREISSRAVYETLHRLGLDTDNPRSMRKDLSVLRDFRLAQERGKAAVIWALVTGVVGGVVAAVWSAIKEIAK